MGYGNILYKVKQGVTTITRNRPRYNGLGIKQMPARGSRPLRSRGNPSAREQRRRI